MKYQDEESANHWSRGDLHGEWSLNSSDICRMFGPLDWTNVIHWQEVQKPFSGNDTMRPCMTSDEAIVLNADYRARQEAKMHSFSWQANMLNAFHNLHFILYMADMLPDFNKKIDAGPLKVRMDVPGRTMWIFQLIMKAATECLRDDFITESERRGPNGYDPSKYRFSPIIANDGTPGMYLHITGECLFYLYVEFKPRVNPDGTFGCRHRVLLECSTWEGDRWPLTGKGSSSNPLKANMLAMKKYIGKELTGFDRMLRDADFNRPENSLANLNGK